MESFRRGDATSDGKADISDAIAILGRLFLGGAAPTCPDAADAGDSGVLDVTDPIYLLGFLFLGGAAVPDPGPYRCGPDPREDALPPCSYPPERCP